MPLTTAFHRRYTVYSRRQRRQPKSDAHAVVHVQRRPTSEAGGESVLPAGEYRYQGGSTIITTNRAVRDRPLAPASLRFFTILNGMPQSRALLARRIDALGASSYLRDGTLGGSPLPSEQEGGPLALFLLPGDPASGGFVLFHHPVALLRQDPRQDQPASPLHPRGDLVLEIDEDLGENVRQDEVVPSLQARQGGRGGVKPVLHAVDPGVFPGHLHRLRVEIDPHGQRRAQAGRGDPEDSRAGPDVQHPAGSRGGVEGFLQELQAHLRRLVRPGAERLAGVDGENDLPGGGRVRLPRRLHGDPPPDPFRLEVLLPLLRPSEVRDLGRRDEGSRLRPERLRQYGEEFEELLFHGVQIGLPGEVGGEPGHLFGGRKGVRGVPLRAEQSLVVGHPQRTFFREEVGDGVHRLPARLHGERFPACHPPALPVLPACLRPKKPFQEYAKIAPCPTATTEKWNETEENSSRLPVCFAPMP